MKITELLLLFMLAMITGGWMATKVVFARGYRRMSQAAYIEAEQINSKLACKYFAPSIVITVIISIVYLFQLGDTSLLAYRLTALSAAILAITAIFVKAKVLPMNDQIQTWSPTAPPDNWRAVRQRWIRFHNVRTILGLLAFFIQTVAILWR